MGSYRITVKNGQQYIVFKGYPGLRRILTSPRYRVDSPKVLKLGIGLDAAKGMAKSGALITVFISATLNSIEWIFNEDYGWPEFVGNVSSDIVKASIAAAAGYLAYAGVAAISSVAVVPLGLGIVVGLAASAGLYLIDRDLQITEKLITSLSISYDHWRALTSAPLAYADRLRQQTNEFFFYIFSEVGELVIQEASNALKSKLRELTRNLNGHPLRTW